MQAKKTIVKLSYDVFGAQEVVENPLFSQTTKVCPEYGGGVGPKVAGLVDGNEEVFQLKGVELKVAWFGLVAKIGWVERVGRIPLQGSSVCMLRSLRERSQENENEYTQHATDTLHDCILHEALSI